jgi:hypothetical protein
MKLIVSIIAWTLMPLAALVVAFQVAKAYVEECMMPGIDQ